MTVRSIRSSSTTKLPGKHRIRVITACFSTALPGYRTDKCLHGRQDILNDYIDTLRGRMHAIRLIEAGVRSDALQEKRVQPHPQRLATHRQRRVGTPSPLPAVNRPA